MGNVYWFWAFIVFGVALLATLHDLKKEVSRIADELERPRLEAELAEARRDAGL